MQILPVPALGNSGTGIPKVARQGLLPLALPWPLSQPSPASPARASASSSSHPMLIAPWKVVARAGQGRLGGCAWAPALQPGWAGMSGMGGVGRGSTDQCGIWPGARNAAYPTLWARASCGQGVNGTATLPSDGAAGTWLTHTKLLLSSSWKWGVGISWGECPPDQDSMGDHPCRPPLRPALGLQACCTGLLSHCLLAWKNVWGVGAVLVSSITDWDTRHGVQK